MDMILYMWAGSFFVVVCMLLLLTARKATRHKWQLGGKMLAALLIASFPLIAGMPLTATAKLVAAILHLWLLILVLRLVIGRLETVFLRLSTQVNAYVLLISYVIFIGFIYSQHISAFLLSADIIISAWIAVSAGAGAIALAHIVWTLRHFELTLQKQAKSTVMPTVSLCIPARNETHNLTACLMAAITSDYPKLEIIVLDDCSQDKTSHVIKAFARDGVRFIQGDVPADGWLGKNQAMQTLAEHAVGDILIFMDVDTILSPHSISYMVQYDMQHKLDMVSILPQQSAALGAATLLPVLQYFWRIAMPITKRRIPVSSKIWMIKAAALQKLGGFASVKHKIVPEGSFARRLHSINTYRFIVSGSNMGIFNAKPWVSQIKSAVRIMYPNVKRQPVYVLGVILAFSAAMLMPFLVAITSWILYGGSPLFWIATSLCILWLTGYALVQVRINPRAWLASTLLLPFSLLQEIAIFIISMFQYEFGRVDWKGRNVCYPVVTIPPRGFRE